MAERQNAQTWTAPVVIEAELPPLPQSQTQEPVDYQKEMQRVRSISNDVAGGLMYGPAWPHARKLAAIERNLPYTDKPIELEAQRKYLHKILWEDYPQYAEKLGVPKPPVSTATLGTQDRFAELEVPIPQQWNELLSKGSITQAYAAQLLRCDKKTVRRLADRHELKSLALLV
jgi:hypothetical protein